MKKITITEMAYSGHGIGIDETGIEYYVLGAFIDDIVITLPYHSSEGVHYAEIVSIEKSSSHRSYIPTQAPFVNAQAPWLYLADKAEQEYKTLILNTFFQEYGIQHTKVYTPQQTNRYRNKSAFAFTEYKGELSFANFQRGVSGNKKQIYSEHILNHPMIEKIAGQFLNFFNHYTIPKDELKYLTLRYSYATDTCVAHILVTQDSRKKLTLRKIDMEQWMQKIPELQGILVSYSLPNIRSAKVEKDIFEIGNIVTTEKVLGKEYIYHPSQFFQIYPKAFGEILNDIENFIIHIPDIKSYELLDVFSGIGIIGIHLAQHVGKVVAIEHSPLSKEYALYNAQYNGVRNFDCYEVDADSALEYINSQQIVIVDPPRSGLSKAFIQKIKEFQPEYLIYVSCNPETQKRDIQYLSEIYQCEYMRGYNLFPKTHHIEHLLILKRKNSL